MQEAATLCEKYQEPPALGSVLKNAPTYEKAWLSFIVRQLARFWLLLRRGTVKKAMEQRRVSIPSELDQDHCRENKADLLQWAQE